jgi:hypothetical protein
MKTPRRLCQGNAGQMSLLPESAFSPVWPSPSTLAAIALEQFLKGRTLTHEVFHTLTGSWRLAAYVRELRANGWPIDTADLSSPIEDKPDRLIALYSLPQRFIGLALAIRAGG